MFVYILKYIDGKRFKIGKANDIYQRIRGIGGMEAYDLASSLCLQLRSEADAYRIEKILHRLFSDWHLEVDKGNRFDGDTEQFSIECFERVVKFLTDNADLTAGAMPCALPPAPVKASTPDSILDDEDRNRARAEAQMSRIKELLHDHETTLQKLRTLVRYVSDGSVRCGIWNDPNGDGRRLFTSVRGGNKECLTFCGSDLPRTFVRPAGGGYGSIFGGGVGTYNEDSGTGFFINDCSAMNFLSSWVSGIAHVHRDYVDALPEIRTQVEEMISIIQRIPIIDDDGVFSLMQFGGVMRNTTELQVDGLLQEIHEVMITLHQREGKCFWRVDLASSADIDAWIIKYCAHGLATLGCSEDEIASSIEAIRADTKSEVESMPREVDEMFGGFVYA